MCGCGCGRSQAASYRALVGPGLSADLSASLLVLETTVSPISEVPRAGVRT